jgi:hypothetical protein
MHAGAKAFVQPFCVASDVCAKPSILPPSMSRSAAFTLCGPPPLTSWWSTNGAMHFRVAGSGAHTVGLPFSMGMPSAPGKVPK